MCSHLCKAWLTLQWDFVGNLDSVQFEIIPSLDLPLNFTAEARYGAMLGAYAGRTFQLCSTPFFGSNSGPQRCYQFETETKVSITEDKSKRYANLERSVISISVSFLGEFTRWSFDFEPGSHLDLTLG